MNPHVLLAFGLAMMLGAICCLLLLPQFRNKLHILRDAHQITPADAALKLRFFVLITAAAFALGSFALHRFFNLPPTP